MDGGPAGESRGRLGRFVAVLIPKSTITSTIGIDAGPIFQIIAVQNLGLSPQAIGIAFGLGVLSIPVQLWAARTPLWRAKRNLQTFMVISGMMCWVLAAMIAWVQPGDGVAVVALGLTVLAEISVSVLYATSWQPLMNYALGVSDRQRLNSRGNAAGGVLMVSVLLVFGSVGDSTRVAMLIVIGGVAVAAAIVVDGMVGPERPADRVANSTASDPASAQPISADLRRVYWAISITAIAAWPLAITYADKVFWSARNLGYVGAAQFIGMLLAAALWRPTQSDVLRRARFGALGLVIAASLPLTLQSPIDQSWQSIIFLGALCLGGASFTTVMLCMLELAHRSVDETNSVRAMTVLDVVGSSSMQAGLLFAGFLIAASSGIESWIDPYRIYLILATVGAAAAILRVHAVTVRDKSPAE